MRIIIVGAGQVGTQLARNLIEEKHDVAIIESDEEVGRHLSSRLDCMVCSDEGNSLGALEAADIGKADVLICVTGSDEINMIICGLAARYPKLLKIARVRNDEYVRRNFQYRNEINNSPPMGIDFFIHPDMEAARSALDAIEHGAVGNILSFADTPFEIGTMDIASGSSFDGFYLKDLRTLIEGDSLVILIERKDETILPGGTTRLLAGDRIYFLSKEKELNAGFKLSGYSDISIRKIGIVGGGRLGSLIAAGLLSREKRRLNETGDEEEEKDVPGKRKKTKGIMAFIKTLIPKSLRKIIIIERDRDICRELSGRFPDALILNEDISDESFIAEEKIGDLDLIVTATEHQELNIITAVYLKSRGVSRAIAIVDSTGYAAIAKKLGVDVVIPQKTVVVDSILSKLIGGGIKSVHSLGEGKVDILEVEIAHGCRAEGQSLKDFHLPEGALVMLVNRKTGDDFIPRGDYVYTEGHRLFVIARSGTEAEIETIFGKTQSSVREDNKAGEKK